MSAGITISHGPCAPNAPQYTSSGRLVISTGLTPKINVGDIVLYDSTHGSISKVLYKVEKIEGEMVWCEQAIDLFPAYERIEDLSWPISKSYLRRVDVVDLCRVRHAFDTLINQIVG
jgi:hypothetical protein